MEILKNNDYEITVTGMTSEGNGVGRIGDFAVFIPDTAPGETCLVKLVQKRNTYGFGKLLKVLVPSPERIDPDCAAFPRCGGCVYRHLSYTAECEAKEQVVRDAFARIGHIEEPVSPIVGSKRVTQYRNKAQYPFGVDKDGKVICGFFARRSHRIIPCENCALHSKLFEAVRKATCELVEKHRIPVYNEETHKGLLRHLYLRMAEKTGEMMVCFVAAKRKDKLFEPLAKALMEQFGAIKSVILNVNPEKTNVILGSACVTLAGNDTITDILCGVKIELSPLSFYQINRDQAEVLYEKALSCAELKPTDTLIDLYCGAGTIGLAAANRVKKLIGVEIVPEAIENAKKNARLNGIENASFICADAGEAATQLAKEGIQPDVIVVDPPRKGLDEAVISAIGKMAPERLVMVSCNPSTAARDAALLKERGYQIKEIVPVDMFPRTHHVECIVRLSREKCR